MSLVGCYLETRNSRRHEDEENEHQLTGGNGGDGSGGNTREQFLVEKDESLRLLKSLNLEWKSLSV